jgi:hypothetical protein
VDISHDVIVVSKDLMSEDFQRYSIINAGGDSFLCLGYVLKGCLG